MKSSEKYKYLSKNVILFALNSFIPKILSFMLIPIYTNILTTSEYGISELITTTVTLLIPIFSLDICDAAMRFALDKNYDNDAVFSISFKINGIGIFIVSLFTFFLYFLGFIKFDIYYLIFFVIYYIFTSLHNLFLPFCKGIEKVKSIVLASIINSIVTLLSNILFLVVFKLGIIGYLLANSLGLIISVCFLFFHAKLYKYITKTQQSIIMKNMLKYSIPLIFNVIGWWVNNASDRYIVTWMLGTGVSGLYSISYKIPSILTSFQTIFSQAWSISAIKNFDKNDADGFIGNTYNLMFFSMTLICSMIMIMNIPLAKMLYSKDFFEAWKYVPPLLISVVVNCMSSFVGSIYTSTNDTKIISVSAISGAVFNIIFNIVLIYLIGPYGAAISTLIGYFIVLFIRHLYLNKHINMKINHFNIILSYIILIIQMILAYFKSSFIIFELICLLCLILLNLNTVKIMICYLNKILKKIFNKNKKKNTKLYEIKTVANNCKNLQIKNNYENSLVKIRKNGNALKSNETIKDKESLSNLIRQDNSFIKEIDFNKNYDFNIVDLILEETRIYNFNFKNEYFLRNEKYPSILCQNHQFVKYIIDKDFNNICYIDTLNLTKEEIKNIINYTFRKIYFLQEKDNSITFNQLNKFSKNDIINNDYFQECLKYIKK